MKAFTINTICLFILMGCADNDIVADQQELNFQSPTQERQLDLLYLVDGVELKNRQELLALKVEKYRATIYPKNSLFAAKFGERVKYGVVVMTTRP